ncbi:MAG TPA: 2-oxoacid:acceptor oxidoreductase family protein [bacterium]|nr:2-oxoacid:acceptor oxidoreductase family protein [bacterium]HPP29368.1 2-oxoacid:acceptor oxidoreductase family protein [bacterium]
MEEKIFEIRWHGRGGQGAKTAALLFGDAALSTGKYIQAFPEYGPERMGAPVQSFNRISSSPIRDHSNIENPDVVVVLDVTLVGQVDVTKGLDAEKGVLIINTPLEADEIKKKLGYKGRVCTVDASRIAMETIGKDIPNTPMIGALVRVTGILSIDELIEDTKKKLEKKFRNRPEIVEGNINAIKRAYNEVKGV